MERISALIEKLRDQFAAGADIDQLLLTAQLLEGELRYHRQKGTVPASPHVAVLMPGNGGRPSPLPPMDPDHERYLPQRESPAQAGSARPAAEFRPAEPVKPVATPRPEPAEPRYPEFGQSALAAYAPAEPSAAAFAPEPAEPTEMKAPAEVPKRAEPPVETPPRHNGYHNGSTNQEAAREPQETGRSAKISPFRPVEPSRAEDDNEAFNPIREVPTLTHQISQEGRRELNDAMARDNARSLNDALKGQQKELRAVLTEAPIRDLRKAIGINDRYLFISELFRGDEVMYERSIKTINNFSIYQEAYYWMERELKLKLAWDQEKYSAQLFYQLVRRRFS
jgi:hypothetical protein